MNIIFRRITRDRPPQWADGIRWYVEAHSDTHDMAFPLGMAFVTDPTPWNGGEFPPFLDFVFVVDQERRKGIATELIEACRRKWPTIELTEAISEAGGALLEALAKAEAGRTHDTKTP